ncbi:glycosyltransferase family 2 protein [Echinicola sp. 20G]|uniref:glycosyltransferase family 2 protein n=1 Tax=Echinicola sp. 20G TaxID=2781961 RepID=UPI0019109CE2|nr:glycosyltransferase family 2 protein [Echinicola sp. 20G]
MFKVSVIIPVYNRKEFIGRTILSVLRLKQVGEILIIDDGSTDGSLEICKKIKHREEKIRILRHPNGINRGVSASRNLGIRNASYEYISFLDSDDLYHSDRFTYDEEVFGENRDAKVVYSLAKIKYENGNEGNFGTNENLIRANSDSFYEYVLENDISIGHISSVTFRKTILDSMPKCFDNRLSLHEDTELWHRISRKYQFYPGKLSSAVSTYYSHSDNTIKKRSRKSGFIFIVVLIDNIGLNNLKNIEKKYIIYHIGRAISNPIRPHLLRKLVFHGFQFLVYPINTWFISMFYNWGMKHYRLK